MQHFKLNNLHKKNKYHVKAYPMNMHKKSTHRFKTFVISNIWRSILAGYLRIINKYIDFKIHFFHVSFLKYFLFIIMK